MKGFYLGGLSPSRFRLRYHHTTEKPEKNAASLKKFFLCQQAIVHIDDELDDTIPPV